MHARLYVYGLRSTSQIDFAAEHCRCRHMPAFLVYVRILRRGFYMGVCRTANWHIFGDGGVLAVQGGFGGKRRPCSVGNRQWVSPSRRGFLPPLARRRLIDGRPLNSDVRPKDWVAASDSHCSDVTLQWRHGNDVTTSRLFAARSSVVYVHPPDSDGLPAVPTVSSANALVLFLP